MAPLLCNYVWVLRKVCLGIFSFLMHSFVLGEATFERQVCWLAAEEENRDKKIPQRDPYLYICYNEVGFKA